MTSQVNSSFEIDSILLRTQSITAPDTGRTTRGLSGAHRTPLARGNKSVGGHKQVRGTSHLRYVSAGEPDVDYSAINIFSFELFIYLRCGSISPKMHLARIRRSSCTISPSPAEKRRDGTLTAR